MLKNFTLIILLFLSSALLASEDVSKWLRPQTIPQPEDNKLTKERIELGKLLFFDVRLSRDDSLLCNLPSS